MTGVEISEAGLTAQKEIIVFVTEFNTQMSGFASILMVGVNVVKTAPFVNIVFLFPITI